jgi:hypothetical protein
MAKVRVAGFSVSLDGYGAGPEQSIENPLGKRGMELHEWAFGTKTLRKMAGNAGGSDGVDEDYAAPLDGRFRCLHPWPQHVRSGPRRVAG